MSRQVDHAEVRRMATMWAKIVSLQAFRLEEAGSRFRQALAHERIRAAIGTTGNSAQAELDRIAPRSLTEQDRATLAADRHFLLLAAAQLAKCVKRLPEDDLPQLQDSNLLRLLRNLDEHWEEPEGNAATALRKNIPDIEPGRLQYIKDDMWLEGISVASLETWAEEVDRRISEAH